MDHLEAPRCSARHRRPSPTFELKPLGGGGGSLAQTGAYTPAQIAQAYQFNSITFNGVAGTGSGETIAIVDAYDDPKIQGDLNTFDTQYGLPATTVIRVNETGGVSYPPSDPTGGWELEESLDVEWAHAMAPGATIMLVEASSASDSDLLTAVKYASSHANVVSMSWGGGEFSGETGYDSYFSSGRRGVRGVLGRRRRARLMAGGFAGRSVGRRDGPPLGRGQCVVERVRLERQRWGTERLRVATVVPERRGHADVVVASHPGRRL